MQRLLKTANKSLDVPNGIKSSVPDGASGKALTAGLIAAGSLAGLTAASAGISSRRRDEEGRRESER
jgi:hypothetical protein